jgi:glutamate-1-semialdehyde aminotransferase/acyl carrier protein
MTTENQSTDVARIIESIVREIAHSLNEAPEHIDPTLPFADMGADSLILLEALQEINARYRVSLTVNEIYERVDTIAKVARYIHERGGRAEDGVPRGPEAARDALAVPSPATPRGEAGRRVIEDIVRQQLDLMERQLGLLGKKPGSAATSTRAVAPHVIPEAEAQAPQAAPPRPELPVPERPPATVPEGKPEVDRFSAFSVKLGKDEREEDAEKVDYIQRLIARATAKTPESKRLAQHYRQPLSDNRVSAGFRPLLKEMVYPILAEKAEGARITDIDGNTYLDFTMGFGAYFFGHAPEFITRAIKAQLDRGMPIGPQSPMAGRAAELICELTGHARVTFCNSGTEATMTAVRLARARTGRAKVVIFRNSYHGTFDGFLARTSASSEASRPASLGTPASMVEDTVVLDYGEPSALDYIERHGRDLAAVLVEPVQSRNPSLQPAAFLHKLRRLTTDLDIALVFDEVITGFRCARGGAQEIFGVRADLCTYGKILGGGMPIGIVAGSAAYMDGLDGGFWQYGDASFPGTSTIFFAGTFSKHPLALAAALAVLEHIQAAGNQLYHTLNERTDRFCAQLSAAFEAEGVDVKVECFASIFRFASKGNLDVFYYRILEAGYFIWEGRNCFLSTAHTEEDLRLFVETVQRICRELVACRLLPVRAAGKVDARAEAPISAAQRRFYHLAQEKPDGAIACNLCFGLRFDAAVDARRLARAVASVLSGQDALWCRFDFARATQQLLPIAERQVRVDQVHVPEPATEDGLVDRLMATQQKEPLSPEAGGNVRATITTFDDGATLLCLCVHHLVCDGWALAMIFERIAAIYSESPAEVHSMKAAHAPYVRWLDHEATYRESEQYASDQRFWQGTIDLVASYQRNRTFGAFQHRHTIGGRTGGRAQLGIDARLTALFKAQAKADGVTPFTALLAGFQVFLSRAYRTRLPIVGIPFANRTTRELKQVVGTCVNLLPLLPFHGPNATFDMTLAYTKHAMAEMFKHSMFPYQEICAQYRVATSEAHVAPVEVTFNVEPVSQLPRFDEQRPQLIAAVNDRIEFDLMFNVFVLESDIRIDLDYDIGLLAEDAVYGLLNLYAKIVENYANRADPARRPNAPAQEVA